MPWPEALRPVRMQRVALVAPADSLRDVLVAVAERGGVDFDDDDGDTRLAGAPPEPEAELGHRSALATAHGRTAGLVGWVPAGEVEALAAGVSAAGGVVVPIATPPGTSPPTLLAGPGPAAGFGPVVDAYGTVPYADVDPSLPAAVAYIAMVGLMFADVGHGALLVAAALVLRAGRRPGLERWRRAWGFLLGAGAASVAAGLLYGEFFGPTGVVPTLWMDPLDHPGPVLVAAVIAGAALLLGAQALGAVDRALEVGTARALTAATGPSGLAFLAGLAAAAGGWYLGRAWLLWGGAAVAAAGLAGAYAGMYLTAGGGPAAAAQAGVEAFDLAVRLLSNLVSFARLAAFGMTHAALGWVVWTGTASLAGHGPGGVAAAVAVFVVGNAVSFALEGLIAAVQALRLEYYEMFSRIFDGYGRPYRPWHLPVARVGGPC